MKKIERILITLFVVALILFFGISISANNFAIENVNFTYATANVDNLNMRQGPSRDATIVTRLSLSQAVRVLGKIGDWYFVFDPSSGKVGAVNGTYITPVTPGTMDETKLPPDGSAVDADPYTVPDGLSNYEMILFELVNIARENVNAGKLQYYKNLARVAQDKARDMVENNYFSHNSATYGTPFEMMRSYGIVFSAGSENIAGNRNVERAFYSWMESDNHRRNIENPQYNKMGVGIYASPIYGKIIVLMFIYSG